MRASVVFVAAAGAVAMAGACGAAGDEAAPALLEADAGIDGAADVAVPEAGRDAPEAGPSFSFDDVSAVAASTTHAFVTYRDGIARCTRAGCERLRLPDPLIANRRLAIGPDDSAYTASGALLFRCGGTPFDCAADSEVALMNQVPPSALVVGASRFYWTSLGKPALYAAPRGKGGTPTTTTLARPAAPLSAAPVGVLVGDGDDVRIVDDDPGVAPRIVAKEAAVRAVRTRGTDAASARLAFVTSAGHLVVCLRDDCEASALTMMLPESPASIALGEQKVYWTSPTTGEVWGRPYAASAPAPMITGAASPRFLAVNGDTLFFTTSHTPDGSGPSALVFADP